MKGYESVIIVPLLLVGKSQEAFVDIGKGYFKLDQIMEKSCENKK